MKTLPFFLSFFLFSHTAIFAQIGPFNIYGNLTCEKIYLGIRPSVDIGFDPLRSIFDVDFRFGIESTWYFAKWGRLNGFFAGGNKALIVGGSVIANPLNRLEVAVGRVATPASQLNPHPVGPDHHFLPRTMQKIPGTAWGGMVKYSITDGYSISGGYNIRNGVSEYTLQAKLAGQFWLATWYAQKLGVAVKWEYGPAVAVIVLGGQDDVFSSFMAFMIDEERKIEIFQNVGVEKLNELHYTIGVRKILGCGFVYFEADPAVLSFSLGAQLHI